jgi:hypothetical protein
MTTAERRAIRIDAVARIEELRAIRAALWVDRDDAYVMSELTIVDSQIRAAEQALDDR